MLLVAPNFNAEFRRVESLRGNKNTLTVVIRLR